MVYSFTRFGKVSPFIPLILLSLFTSLTLGSSWPLKVFLKFRICPLSLQTSFFPALFSLCFSLDSMPMSSVPLFLALQFFYLPWRLGKIHLSLSPWFLDFGLGFFFTQEQVNALLLTGSLFIDFSLYFGFYFFSLLHSWFWNAHVNFNWVVNNSLISNILLSIHLR